MQKRGKTENIYIIDFTRAVQRNTEQSRIFPV